MIDLRQSADGFALLFNGLELLRHSPALPLLEQGLAKATYKAKHATYRIKDATLDWKKAGAFSIQGDSLAGYRIDFKDFGCLIILERDGRLHININSCQAGTNRLLLRLCAGPEERIFGCGEQYSHFNLRGKKVPLFTQEQGIGRGPNPVKWAADLVAGAGGNRFSTYFALPVFVSSALYSCYCRCRAWCGFDFRRRDRHELLFWEMPEEIVFDTAPDMASLSGRLARFSGLQPALPDWVYEGLILGAQGGTDTALRKLSSLRSGGAAVSALWIQDWEGRRLTSFGSQLFWNWQMDKELYPDLPATIKRLNHEGVRVLGYINPFLAIDGPLFREASAYGYLVRKADGSDYIIQTAGFPAALLDLSHPEAFAWIKSIIKRNLIGIGLAGWMADFGEYLPIDAVLHSGESGETAHNRYPALWAQASYEAVAEAGKLDEILFFNRSGHLDSARHVPAFWAGDQMVSWCHDDGLASIIPAALSLGVCGVGQWHADIGGYTTLAWVRRSRELLLRWIELSAFTPLMRSHEGNRPERNAQLWDNPETVSQSARFSRIYRTLAPYRRQVAAEYRGHGLPFMRPLFFYYQNSANDWNQKYSWLYGRDLLVAPVRRPRRFRHRLWLPDDRWVHIWSGRIFTGGWHTVAAPVGQPPVFFRADSEWRDLFLGLETGN